MKEWFGLVARLVVGMVWVVAGAIKLPDPASSVQAVRAYQLLPGGMATTVGQLLPVVEIVIGLTLVLGVLTRGAAVASAILFIVYIAAIASVWARGISIDCGCFGGGGLDPNAASKYPWEIARDLALLLLSGYLVWAGRSRFAVDNLIFRSPAVPAPAPERR